MQTTKPFIVAGMTFKDHARSAAMLSTIRSPGVGIVGKPLVSVR